MTDPETPTNVDSTESAPESTELSDADLRLWAKDNGVEGVPVVGRLSSEWRETILAAMATPAPESESETAPESESETAPESESETTQGSTSEETTEPENDGSEILEESEPVVVDEPAPYKTPYRVPDTWVSGQYLTTGL